MSTDLGGQSTVSLQTGWNADLKGFASDGTTLLGISRKSKDQTDSVALTLPSNATSYARVTWASRTPSYSLSATGAVR